MVLFSASRPVMVKLHPTGQTRPPERFYPVRDMIPNLTNEKKRIKEINNSGLFSSSFLPFMFGLVTTD
jgi:hypothetical protein